MATSTRPASGRPRNPEIDRAVLRATTAALKRTGYVHLSLEEVAREAGTSKPALYRRWPGRQQLVLAALGAQLGEVEPPDTGCILCDLDDCLKLFVRAFRSMPPGVLGPLFADCSADPRLRADFMTALFEPPREAVRRTLVRARAEGRLRDDVDLELVLDLIGSFVHYRVLFGHAPTTDAEVERAVRALLQGVGVDYSGLLEQSRRVKGDPKMHHLHRRGSSR